MKTRLLVLGLISCLTFAGGLQAQSKKNRGGGAPSPGDRPPAEKTEKKAAPKSPADQAADDFYKVRNQQGAKQDQAHFTKVIAAGMAFLQQYPTHGRAADVVRDLGNYASDKLRDKATAAMRPVYVSQLQYEALNARYKEGLSEDAMAAIAAVATSAADAEARDMPNKQNMETLREKIDALAQVPGSARFLAPRERSYAEILSYNNPARGEEHLKSLLTHKQKPVADMARRELDLIEIKKQPYGLKFTGLDGKEVDFAQLRGKIVAMYFWTSTSGSSTRHFEAFKQIASDYKNKPFAFVTVSFDKAEDREKLEKFVKDNKITWPVHYDGKGAKAEFATKLSVSGAPRLVLFDQDGMLLTNDLPPGNLEAAIKKLLDEAAKKKKKK
jgi:peroxiredoxin